jgi:SAM-dependent methyltransferase
MSRSSSDTFEQIYSGSVWGKNSRGVGTSGSGSTLESTLLYRTFLQQFLKDNEIRSVVDAGCGDWEFSRSIDWTGIDYKGFDIVEPVISRNREAFAKPGIQFFAGSIVELELPTADLLLSKHVLQHVPNSDVQRFLGQREKFRHVLLTNAVNSETLSATNGDITVGAGRALDLTKPPFQLQGTKVLTYWDGIHMSQVFHIHHRVLTEAEAKERLAERGYRNAGDFKRNDNGLWMGPAQKGERFVDVAVDVRGNVYFRDPNAER